MSNIICPRKFWGIPSWADQLVAVGLRAVFFRTCFLVKCLGKTLQKWERGKVLMMLLGQLLCGGVYSLGW